MNTQQFVLLSNHLLRRYIQRSYNNVHIARIFFAKKALDVAWYWYRFEWQMRGTIHVHGMIRLKTDPGLTDLAQHVIIKGRKAWRQLLTLQHSGHSNSFDEYKQLYPDDVYIVSSTIQRLCLSSQRVKLKFNSYIMIFSRSLKKGCNRKLVFWRSENS